MLRKIVLNKNSEKFGIALAFLAMFGLSAGDGFWKYSLGVTTIPVVFGITFLVSVIVLALYAQVSNTTLKPKNNKNILIYSILFGLEQVTFIYALRFLPLIELFIIVLTIPILVMVVAHFLLNEKLTPSQIASIFSGFIGAAVVVVFQGGTAVTDVNNAPFAMAGVVFAFSHVLTVAGKIIFMRKYCEDENVFGLGIFSAALIAVVCFVIAGKSIWDVPILALFLLFCAGIVSAVSQLAYARACQLARAPMMAATQYSQIIWATLMGIFLFEEHLSLSTFVGSVLIIVSAVLLYGPFSKKA